MIGTQRNFLHRWHVFASPQKKKTSQIMMISFIIEFWKKNAKCQKERINSRTFLLLLGSPLLSKKLKTKCKSSLSISIFILQNKSSAWITSRIGINSNQLLFHDIVHSSWLLYRLIDCQYSIKATLINLLLANNQSLYASDLSSWVLLKNNRREKT